jgi:5'-nucleotidase
MNISRKEFLKKSTLLATGSLLPMGLVSASSGISINNDITILYTNDTHSRLDPFPMNAKEFAGLGGIARRSSLINQIRSTQKNVLLLDAGDVFQGTSWFDVYGGEVDFKLMSEMNYDAMTIGNHEFDLGPDGFADAAKYADFPFLAANYIVRNTPMASYVQRQIVKEFDGFKIGIFGLGIEFEGVIDRSLTGSVRAANPIRNADQITKYLKNSLRCDYIICLSHLGFYYSDERVDDHDLANSVENIDLIIGGHTHTFLDQPVVIQKASGKSTYITQMGHSGVRLGRIDLTNLGSMSDYDLQSLYYTVGEDG